MSITTRQALVDHLRHHSLRTDGRFLLRSGGAAVPDRAPVVGDPGARDRGTGPAVTA